MQRIKTIVIEDEPLALKKLVSFINKIEYLELSKTFDNAIEAISYLKTNKVELIFLDIQMEEFTGIQFLESIKHRPKVIITTAYDQYAIKGYELDIADYLLKPYTFERLLMAVEKVSRTMVETAGRQPEDAIFVKTEYRLEKVNTADILYIEGMSEYLRVVTRDKKIMTLQNFKCFEEVLPKNGFVRVHKSFMVAINKIESIERNRIRIHDTYIPISDTYKDLFFEKIGVSRPK
jgi:DNA-binding LytR/AlgR family response regulator